MDNLIGLLFVYLAKIYAFIHKIVTRTEILAQVSLLLVTNFKWNQPILGYMLSVHVGYDLQIVLEKNGQTGHQNQKWSQNQETC